MDHQPQQRGVTSAARRHFVPVSLFTEVKMRRESMFEKVDQQIARQNQHLSAHRRARARLAQSERFRNHLQENSREHEARAQRHKILQVLARPLAADNQPPAGHVRPSRRHP